MKSTFILLAASACLLLSGLGCGGAGNAPVLNGGSPALPALGTGNTTTSGGTSGTGSTQTGTGSGTSGTGSGNGGSGSGSGTSSPPPTNNSPVPIPSNATIFDSLQSASNWQSCDSPGCAGGSGAGSYWLAQNQSTPSLSGGSMQVYNSGAWANALWWQKVGSNPSASNFVWDFDVQLDDASQTAGQALEFDVFQFLDGYNYMMGTECNYSTGVWDLWDEAAGHWRPTSSPCAKFQPGVWHHVQWYMQRTPGRAAYTFVTVAVDGVSYPMNKTYSAKNLGWEANSGVQYQLDVNASGRGYNEWVDNVQLAVW